MYSVRNFSALRFLVLCIFSARPILGLFMLGMKQQYKRVNTEYRSLRVYHILSNVINVKEIGKGSEEIA